MRIHAKCLHRRAYSLTPSAAARCVSAALIPIRRPLITAILGVVIAIGVPVTAGSGEAVFIVNSDGDRLNDGCDARHCNLREAILAANKSGRGAEIHFDLPARPYRIHPRSALPAIQGLIVLDGATQDGTECPAPLVHIDGSMIDPDTPANGLEVLGDGNEVRGLSITGFSGHGVVVLGDGNRVQCVYAGVNPAGEPAGNDRHGIAVIGGHSNTIGGPVPEDGNLLAANGGQGLYIEDALYTTRQYNAIGVDVLGEPRLPNDNTGLEPIIPPPPPNERDTDAVEDITAEYERRIADIAARSRDSLQSSGLFEKYMELLSGRDQRVPPADLNELVDALSREPDLYAAFTGEAAAVLAEADAAAAAEIDRAGRGYRKSVASLGRDVEPVPLDSGDLLGEFLSNRAPGDFTVSGEPSTVIAVEGGVPGPITIDPLRWHSLQTYGPLNFNSEASSSQAALRICISETTVCQWPIAYDFLPAEMELLWYSPTFSAQELSDIVTENGYVLELFVNGMQLLKGPPFGSPSVDPEVAAKQGFWAVSWSSTEPCPLNNNCLSTVVAARKKLANVPQPWTFEIRIREVTELETPQIIGIDEFGNPILATHSYETLDETSRTIEPNLVSGGQHWFTEALANTFYHPRCSDCHGFGTIENLAIHHNLGGDTQAFIAGTGAHLEPSAYVPGAHVIACDNCHTVPLQDNHGHPFHETDWIAPYHDLDVNWSQKSPSQICSRVITNLPTFALRHQHFHGDGRLFWAIENPWVVSHSLDPAPPNDFDEFLRRVDLWNAFGAPCP